MLRISTLNQVHVRKRARENEAYLDHVLLEVERLWPSFIGGRRVAKQVQLFFVQLKLNSTDDGHNGNISMEPYTNGDHSANFAQLVL